MDVGEFESYGVGAVRAFPGARSGGARELLTIFKGTSRANGYARYCKLFIYPFGVLCFTLIGMLQIFNRRQKKYEMHIYNIYYIYTAQEI